MSAPVWPDGLQDGTPLPFSVWRVMHHVDGQRDISEVARLAGMTVPDVQERLNAAAAWIARATQRDLPISDDLAERISQCLTGVVGPMAAVMVDEVLDDLGDHATLNATLSALARQLTPERVQLFARLLRERGVT
ncbi:hypothetical protein GCM10008956_20890 [Deinococcus arenae]|mgnify:CR=1 FL=1|uniref:DUF8082 domain-containing protein n=2 Tax=Deinococcus TaxID=1298 RepID=A0A8H9GQ58_9DEIO|nr:MULTISPECIES: hypothetical protein [Deinococcus]ALW90312.1 hypothetical protein AUC44_05370 [Deinococcus actinosclerus]AWT37071.1 hypothetical protein DM785_05875 [Deinococcus actinosclerus]GGM44435.1 hypothetical protein GCM10008956_20890 [Deinococcus arenae]